MNPDTNRFEPLAPEAAKQTQALESKIASMAATLLRPNGEPVPKTWTQFAMGEMVVIKDYTFRVAYIGETSILFEPVGVPVIGENEADAG